MENNNRVPMSAVLASNGIKTLGDNLNLTNEQKQRATSAALRLSADENLRFCDSFSIAKYCFEIARYNFTRDDCVYPVPYKNKIQAQIGYKGYREMALQAGYQQVDCSEVRECDTIYRDKVTGEVKVSFNEDYSVAMKSRIIGYYAFAIENGSLSKGIYWNIEKLMEHGKHYSKSFDKIWGDSFNQDKMFKKTLIKQLCSQLRSTPQLDGALKMDGLVYGTENESNEYADNPNNEKTDNIKSVTNVIDDLYDVIDAETVENEKE